MKQLTTYVFLAVAVCAALAFSPAVKNGDDIGQKKGKYYYFMVVHVSGDKTYISNLVWIEGSDYESIKEVRAKKEAFQSVLKEDYKLEWPVTNITAFDFSDEDLAKADRKRRMGSAGTLKHVTL